MLITKLQIVGLRSIEQAEFTFQPGMNLLVGVNGVGKTTVLDALRIGLSRVLPEVTSSRSPAIRFEESDIRIGDKSLQVTFTFNFENVNFNFTIRRQREKIVNGKKTALSQLSNKFPDAKSTTKQSLGVYFSTRRSLIVDQEPSKTSTVGGQAAAFADSLSPNRELNLRLLAQWFRAQETLGKENPVSLKHVEALRNALSKFMPGFQNLAIAETHGATRFTIEKKGTTLSLSQLSDGERGVLSIVLDLARRLSQANPGLEDPVKDGEAIVLIDELDLHLHPKWQRSVVENLTRTFQNCQFIATTHSPQIIPAVEPERVQLMKGNEIIRPDRTLGMDSNWILRRIMEADDRPEDAAEAIKQIEKMVKEGDYEEARDAMVRYRQDGLDLPEWAMLEARISRFEMLGEE